WKPIESCFGLNRFRSFDEPILVPEYLREGRDSIAMDLVTLHDATSFIDKLTREERQAKVWQAPKTALEEAGQGGSIERARMLLERALKHGRDHATATWYNASSVDESPRHPEWVIVVRDQMLAHLRAGYTASVDGLASGFDLKPALAERLLNEL